MKHHLPLALLAALLGPAVSPRAADPRLDQQALSILEKHCHRCHGKDGSREGGMNYILDLRQLVERKNIIPGTPARSRLFRRSSEGDMPPEDEQPRPSPTDVAVLKSWIASLSPVAEPPGKVAEQEPGK